MKILEQNEQSTLEVLLRFTKEEMKLFLNTVVDCAKPANCSYEDYKEIIKTKSPSSEFEEILQKLYSLVE